MLKRIYKIYKNGVYIDSVELTENSYKQRADFLSFCSKVGHDKWDIIPTNLYKHYSLESALNN